MLVALPFSANILNAHKFILNRDSISCHERVILDYELDYYIMGGRKMILNGESFSVDDDTIVFRKPGDHVVSYGNYNCYVLTLDFSKKKGDYHGTYDRVDPSNVMQELSDNKLLDLIPSRFAVKKTSEYVRIYEELCYHAYRDNADTTKTLLLNQLFCLILSDVCHNALSPERTELQSIILSETHKYIEVNQGRAITLEDLSKNVCLSPSYFSKKFKDAAGMSPLEYVLSIRFTSAKHMLSSTNLPICEIAQSCGFNHAAYFSYYFKKRFGISPKAYRAQTNEN